AIVAQLRICLGDLGGQLPVIRSHGTFSRTFTACSSGGTTNIKQPSAGYISTELGTSWQHREERRPRRLASNRLQQAVLVALEQSSPRYALKQPRFALTG